MTANDSKSYLTYLNKLVDQYNNTYHYFVGKKSSNSDYSVLTRTIETNPKAHKFKVNDSVRITKYKNIFSKGYTENWSREILLLILCWKLILGLKIKDLNGEKIIGKVDQKKLLLSIL